MVSELAAVWYPARTRMARLHRCRNSTRAVGSGGCDAPRASRPARHHPGCRTQARPSHLFPGLQVTDRAAMYARNLGEDSTPSRASSRRSMIGPLAVPRRELHVEELQVVQGPRPRLHRPGARSAANRAQSFPPRGRHRGSVNRQSTESKAISPFFQRAIATSICPLRCLFWPCMTHSHNCVGLSDRSGEVCNNLTASSA